MGCICGGGDPETKAQDQKNKEIEKQLEKDKQSYKATHRLLLLGRYKGVSSFSCTCHNRRKQVDRCMARNVISMLISGLPTNYMALGKCIVSCEIYRSSVSQHHHVKISAMFRPDW